MTTDNKDLTDKIRLILLIRCYIWPDFNDRIKFSTFISRYYERIQIYLTPDT
jgi:hypothetical protein